jgi:hypothetical protein
MDGPNYLAQYRDECSPNRQREGTRAMGDVGTVVLWIVSICVLMAFWALIYVLSIHQPYPFRRDGMEIGKTGAIVIAALSSVLLAASVFILSLT